MPDQEKQQAGSAPAARVHITYSVDGQAEHRELPFVIGVLADLTGQPLEPLPRLRDREFAEIHPDNFDTVMAAAGPHLSFSIDSPAPLSVDLRFRAREDFRPEAIVRQLKPLQELLDARARLSGLSESLTPSLSELLHRIVYDKDALQILDERAPETAHRIAAQHADGEHRRERLTEQVQQFLYEAADRALPLSPDTEAMIAGRIAQLDQLLSLYVSAILHHPSFQQLEATWRGLDFLVRRAHCSAVLKVKVMNASRKELLRDLQRAPEFDQSALFNKIYTEERNSPGAEPFSLLVGDYFISNQPEDVELIERISNVAAASQALFIAGASPVMFNMESLRDLGAPRSLSKIFETMEYAKWRTFRRSRDSRFVALALPRFLLRVPYGTDGAPVDGPCYREHLTGGMPHEHYLWGNAAYAFAERFATSCHALGWPTAVCGFETGGLVRNLHVYTFAAETGGMVRIGPTEIVVDHRREGELTALGFLVFSQQKGTNQAVFYEAMSCSEPERTPSDEQNAMARDAAHLPYTLVLARFLHYGAILLREKERSFESVAEMARHLNGWLQNYVGADEAASIEAKAARPLREASAEVVLHADASKGHQLVLRARPHFRVRCPAKPCQSVVAVPLAAGD